MLPKQWLKKAFVVVAASLLFFVCIDESDARACSEAVYNHLGLTMVSPVTTTLFFGLRKGVMRDRSCPP